MTFSVYYESDGVLPVMEDVSVDVGMPVGGGKEKTVRVDLEKQVLEGGEVSVTTNELLGAVIPSVRLNAQDHQDLSETLAGFSRRRNVVDDLVCVIDDSGDIVMRYASEDTAGLQEDRTLVDNILENYSDWDVSENEGGLGLGVDDIEDGGHRRARRSRGMSVGSALSRKPERTSRRDK